MERSSPIPSTLTGKRPDFNVRMPGSGNGRHRTLIEMTNERPGSDDRTAPLPGAGHTCARAATLLLSEAQ